MRTFLYAIVGALAVIALGYLWLLSRVRRSTDRRDRAVIALLRPVTEPLARGGSIPQSDIAALAQNPLTRNRLFDALQQAARADLFPRAYASVGAVAESDLVYWLAHPHELQQAPDEIEQVARLTRDGNDFVVFKFRVNPPHWKAADGWVAGVAGPYKPDANGSAVSGQAFSHFEPFDTRTPEEHLEHYVQTLKPAIAE